MIAVVTTKGREISLEILTSGYVAPGATTMILITDEHDFGTDPTFVSAIAGDEIVATNYARQVVVFNASVPGATGIITQSSQVVDFGVIGGAVNDNVAGCYLFHDSGVDATSPVVACIPFAEVKATDGTNFSVTATTLTWSPTPF